jgi:hypothetical protein
LSPSIGLAYDVGGHYTTSIRAGYGIYTIREDITFPCARFGSDEHHTHGPSSAREPRGKGARRVVRL